jgi:hypothetical protein
VHHEVRAEARERPRDRVGVLDRVLDDRQAVAFLQVVAPARRVVVDDEGLVALSQQPIGEMGADEPAPTCDQDLHS